MRERAETELARRDDARRVLASEGIDDQMDYLEKMMAAKRLQELDAHIKRTERAIEDRRRENIGYKIERRMIQRRQQGDK